MAFAEVFQCGALGSNSKIVDDHCKLFATGDRKLIQLLFRQVASYVVKVHTKIVKILNACLYFFRYAFIVNPLKCDVD